MKLKVASFALAALAFGCAHRPGAGALTPLEQAKVAIDQGHPQDAIPALEDAHRARPRDLDVARMLVEAYVKSGRSSEILPRLKAAPQDGVDQYMLGLAYFAEPGTVDAALTALAEAARALPKSAEVSYRLGLALVEAERYADALPVLQHAAQLDPTRGAIQLPLAEALFRQGHPDEAVAALVTCVHDHPDAAEVKTARALMGQIADPFADFPQAAKARLDEGMHWLQDMDVPQQAIVSFEEILGDFPDLGVVHALLGLAYERIDDAGRAVEELNRAIELSPKIGRSYLYLGEVYLAHQRPKEAEKALEKAVALDPLLDEGYQRLADLAMKHGELDQARSLYGVLADLEPGKAEPRARLANVEAQAGDYAAASHTLNEVLKKDPENLEFMLRLGLVDAERRAHSADPAERKQAAAEAEKWLQKVLDKQPDNALAARALASVRG